jgi:hypothetical protein
MCHRMVKKIAFYELHFMPDKKIIDFVRDMQKKMESSKQLTHRDSLELCKAVSPTGNSVRFQARGSSMHSFIRDHDFLTIEPVTKASAKRGDVVLYSGDERAAKKRKTWIAGLPI